MYAIIIPVLYFILSLIGWLAFDATSFSYRTGPKMKLSWKSWHKRLHRNTELIGEVAYLHVTIMLHLAGFLVCYKRLSASCAHKMAKELNPK